MRCSIVRSLFQGIQHYKNTPYCRIIHGFNNAKEIRSIRMAHSTTQAPSFSNTDERNAMMAIWPDVVTDLTERLYPDIPAATKWMAEVLNYNVPCGHKHRGLSIIYSYRMLVRPEQLTDENLKLARILAWCYEINEAFWLMQDDMMDSSKIRRGQPCWHLRDNVGVIAVNDSVLLEHASYQLMKMHFNKHECYSKLLETFTKVMLPITLGQVMDISSSAYRRKLNLNLFTMDRYKVITKYSGVSFFNIMPINLAMHFAGVTDPEVYRQTEPILFDLGHLYTVRGDYLDCYGDPNATGKIGTDIARGKCTWVSVTALQHANPSQRKILEECYGHDDPEKVARVKQVYDELDIPTLHANYREKVHNSMKTRIKQMTCDFPKELFDVLMVVDLN